MKNFFSFKNLGVWSVASLISFGVHAQSGVPDTDPREALDKTRIVESSISKVYRARVLLEDYRNWPESYELLRDVISNDDNLNPVIESKLKVAAGQISRYLPGRWLRRTFNSRHLLRPFLESSYLINEALMDWRVPLNSSSDSEVPFVENLLKSYFFPGSEAQGVIEFPDPSTYSFDLFALTAENIAKARRARSDSGSTEEASGVSDSSIGSSEGRDDESNDLGSLELNRRFDASNGFIKEVLDEGVAIVEVTEEVQKIIRRYQVKKRVQNRYLELSMLMQAVSDPGSALFDPQLQAFLKGVRLKLALGVTDALKEEDLRNLRGLLGRKAVVQTPEGVRVLLSYLIEKQSGNPYQKTGMELQVNQVDGTGRSVLYVISAVSGEDLMRLRTLTTAAVLARDVDKVSSLVANSSASPAVAKALQLGYVSFQKMLELLPQAAKFVNDLSQASNQGVVAMSLKLAAGALHGVVAVQNIGVKIVNVAGPRTAQILTAIKNNKYVKNGTVAGVLTFAAAAAQITIGVIEYRHAEDPDKKHEIYVNTLSRTGATLTYALPIVGWGAAALDLSHAFLGVPFETADLFKGFSKGVEEVTYFFMGTSSTQVAYTELEGKLVIPRNEVYFKLKARCEATRSSCEQAIAALHSELQNYALSQVTLLYVAHRSFAAKTNYEFGRRMEDYVRSYSHNRRVVQGLESALKEKIKSLPEETQILEATGS